jgi:hypothetical protein
MRCVNAIGKLAGWASSFLRAGAEAALNAVIFARDLKYSDNLFINQLRKLNINGI